LLQPLESREAQLPFRIIGGASGGAAARAWRAAQATTPPSSVVNVRRYSITSSAPSGNAGGMCWASGGGQFFIDHPQMPSAAALLGAVRSWLLLQHAKSPMKWPFLASLLHIVSVLDLDRPGWRRH